MIKNLFWFERALRGALGVVMLSLAFYGSATLLYVVGGLLLSTGLVGLCPIRAATGLSGLPEAAPLVVRPAAPPTAKRA